MAYEHIIELISHEAEKLNCEVIKNAVLKKYTTFKIGGICDLLIEINGISTCKTLIPMAKKHGIKYLVLGRGSNLIIDDRDFKGVVFRLGNGFSECFCDNGIITAEAGLSLNRLCLTALENSLTGLEFAYGIPGTVGGAVYMNAGAYGGEMKDIIISADILDENGNILTVNAGDMGLSYRNSIFMHSNSVILTVSMRLSKGSFRDIKNKMDELMEKRRNSQPLEYGSAGSMFKRPEGSYASYLIDKCGLKGCAVGDAQVSEKHAGFIVNKGSACFDDLMELIGYVKKNVFEKTGFLLECEPEIITDREEYRQ